MSHVHAKLEGDTKGLFSQKHSNLPPSTMTTPPEPSRGDQYGFGLGAMLFSGTAIMIAQILQVLELLAEINKEFNEIVKDSLSTQYAGTHANAVSSEASIHQDAQSLKDQSIGSFGQAGSAIIAGTGMAIATFGMGRSDEKAADDDINEGKKAQITLSKVRDPDTTTATITDATTSQTTSEPDVEKLAKQLIDNNGIIRDTDGKVVPHSKDQVEAALRYIKANRPPNTLDILRDRLQESVDRGERRKQAVVTRRNSAIQGAQMVGNLAGSAADGGSKVAASIASNDKASQEAAKSYSQFTMGAAQTGTQQSVSSRDQQIQEITALLQTLQQGAQANASQN